MVSVIIPVYNSAYFLSRCLDSVISQTYPNLEVVMIDDGSNDGSANICDDFVKKDLRFKVYHQQNQGASLARRKGVEIARGEWLTFVDSDDIIENDYIERLFHAVQQFHVKVAACDQIQHMEGTDVVVDKTRETMLLDEKELHGRFFSYQFWGFGGKIYHKSVFKDVYFPSYTINEDYVVMAQLFDRYKQIAYVPMGLYHYMIHSDSLSHQKLSPRMFDEFYNKLWVVNFYKRGNPQYVKQSEAQLTETCIKLIGAIKGVEYSNVKREMRQYLRSQIFNIIFNPYLLLALKVMALRRCV
jgi:glycosyltransferase involved in cell wall biosynthesis